MQIWNYVKIIIIIILYILWLECCPGLGNIWLRPDENGLLRVRPLNLIKFLLGPISPTNGYVFWNIEMLDINFVVFFIAMWYFLEIIPRISHVWEYILDTKEENSHDIKNK